MGFPLVGDSLYGGPRADALMLHALEEALLHPLTGERVVMRTAWPERFEADFSGRDYLPIVHT
jgi:23S rRNA pseudouridine1911/1915/1917 synthase